MHKSLALGRIAVTLAVAVNSLRVTGIAVETARKHRTKAVHRVGIAAIGNRSWTNSQSLMTESRRSNS